MFKSLSIPTKILGGVTLAAALSASTYAGDLPKVTYETFTLDNGMRVILSVDTSAPVVATYVLYHVGSANERSDRTGFAHFFEHLMFEGTENIARHQLDKLVQSAGGNLNAHTTFDYTGYQIQLPSNQLKLALWIESERLMHARVEEIGVETQRSVVKEERKGRYENTPFGSWMEHMAANAFDGTPYSWTPIGSAQYIDQAQIEEFRQFYRTYYVPNNAVLAIVGDIDIERTKKLVEAYFAEIPRGEDVPPVAEFPIPEQGEKMVEVVEAHTPVPAVFLAYRTVPMGHPDSYALELLSNILANGNSSRLYRTLVEEQKLALQVAAFPFSLEHGGVAAMLAVGHPTVGAEQLEQLIDEQVDDIKQNGVSAHEFQKSRNQFETQFAARYNGAMDKAMALASYETFHGSPELINTEIEKYMAVTPEDIRRVAREYLIDDNRVVLRYLLPSEDTVH